MLALLRELAAAPWPAGPVDDLLALVEERWRAIGASAMRTPAGSLLARVGGRGPGLLLVARVDERAPLVRAIDPAGFLHLAGGVPAEPGADVAGLYPVGQPVRVLARSGPLPGLLVPASDGPTGPASGDPGAGGWDDRRVATGLTRDEMLARGVAPGVRVAGDGTPRRLGRHVVGGGLTDRAPLAVLTAILRRALRVPPAERGADLTIACTARGEVDRLGTSTLAPTSGRDGFDAAIVVGIGRADDGPGAVGPTASIRLGAGPLLAHRDARVAYDAALSAALERAARHAGIAVQHAVRGVLSGDGPALLRADIPTGMVAFAVRHARTPGESAHPTDLAALVDWLCAFARSDGRPGATPGSAPDA